MSIGIPPRWSQRDIYRTRHPDTGLGDRMDKSKQLEGWSLPEDPHERRRVRNRLIVLAAAIPIVQLFRWLFG